MNGVDNPTTSNQLPWFEFLSHYRWYEVIADPPVSNVVLRASQSIWIYEVVVNSPLLGLFGCAGSV